MIFEMDTAHGGGSRREEVLPGVKARWLAGSWRPSVAQRRAPPDTLGRTWSLLFTHSIQVISAPLRRRTARNITCWHPETITTGGTRDAENDLELACLLLHAQPNLLNCWLFINKITYYPFLNQLLNQNRKHQLNSSPWFK